MQYEVFFRKNVVLNKNIPTNNCE